MAWSPVPTRPRARRSSSTSSRRSHARRLRVDLRLTASTLREPLRRALAVRSARKLPAGAGAAAAVLVPLFERDGEALVWLARRPKTMRSHAGQVAFPGGKHDATDPSLLDTALREADEELGIGRASVDVLGALDDIVTITGFTVSPWVGWLAPDVEVAPNPSEVARAFAAPLTRSSTSRGASFPGVAGRWTASSCGERPPPSCGASSRSCASSASISRGCRRPAWAWASAWVLRWPPRSARPSRWPSAAELPSRSGRRSP